MQSTIVIIECINDEFFKILDMNQQVHILTKQYAMFHMKLIFNPISSIPQISGIIINIKLNCEYIFKGV